MYPILVIALPSQKSMFRVFSVTLHRISYLDSLISSSANAIHSVAPTTIQTITSANVNLFKVLGLIASLIAVQSILHLIVRLRF